MGTCISCHLCFARRHGILAQHFDFCTRAYQEEHARLLLLQRRIPSAGRVVTLDVVAHVSTKYIIIREHPLSIYLNNMDRTCSFARDNGRIGQLLCNHLHLLAHSEATYAEEQCACWRTILRHLLCDTFASP